MNKTYSVYCLTANDGRRYIGMTSRPLSVRCTPSGYKTCPAIHEAIQDLGWEAFQKDLIVGGLSEKEASLIEQEMIVVYDTTNPTKGFNIAHGGLHFKHNVISKHKISKSSTPRKKDFCKKKYIEQEPYKQAVVQLDLSGNVICQFSSIREAAKITKSDPSNIRKCAKGALKTTNHYMWRFN